MLDGDCLGVSLGDPAAVEGADSTVVVVIVRFRSVRCWGTAVEAIVKRIVRGIYAAETIELFFKQGIGRRYIRVVKRLKRVEKRVRGIFC